QHWNRANRQPYISAAYQNSKTEPRHLHCEAWNVHLRQTPDTADESNISNCASIQNPLARSLRSRTAEFLPHSASRTQSRTYQPSDLRQEHDARGTSVLRRSVRGQAWRSEERRVGKECRSRGALDS